MRKIKLVIQYDGTGFCGFQIQPNGVTVQGVIEEALSKIFAEKIKINPSGRTDAGVHAIAQIADFVTENLKINTFQIVRAVNVFLPDTVRVVEAKEVPAEFESRFDSKRKTYFYRFYVSQVELPLISKQAFRLSPNVDLKRMKRALKFFVGKHDFSSFCSSKSGRKDFVRTVFSARIKEIPSLIGADEFCFEISANGFLYNMIRIIFGTLLDVGMKKIEPQQISEIILAKDRKMAGKTAPAFALFLSGVEY